MVLAALAVPAAAVGGPSTLLSRRQIDAATAERMKERPPAGDADRALAEAKATGRPVPVASLTTEFSETVATPEGHLGLTGHPDQQRVKRDGTWQPLDATLTANQDGTFSPKSAASSLVLSKGGDGPLATMTSSDGKKLALTAPFRLTAPVVDGDSVLYPGVRPDTDLKVTATKAGGLTTVLVLRTKAAAADPAVRTLHFDTVVDGVTVESDHGGNLTAKGADGRARWTAPTPQMWDSSAAAPAPAAPAKTAKAQGAPRDVAAAPAPQPGHDHSDAAGPGRSAKVAAMPVKADKGGIDLTPDQDLIANGTAPFYVDPAWVPWTQGNNAWTWIQSAYPGTANWNRSGSADSDHPGVGICGYYAAGGSCSPADKYRSFFQYDINPLNGAVVHYATLNFQEYVSADWTCGNAYPLDLYLTSAISSGTTWGNQPWQVGGSLGQRTVGGSGHTGCYDNVPFNYDITGTLQQYTNNGQLTFGLYGNETNQNAFKRFDYHPSLYVEYDRTPNTPTSPAVWPAPKTVSPAQTTQSCGDGNSNDWAWLGAGTNQDGAVWLNATVSSPTQGQLWSWDHIWDYQISGTPDVASGYSNLVGTGNVTSFAVPGSAIKDGHSYGYSMMASDQLAGVSWSAATPTCYFKVDLTAPTVSFPGTVTDPSKQFPPSGNGQTPQIYAGQSGAVPITVTDPNPSGLNTSGLACLRWGWDSQIADGSWHCGGAMPTGGQIPGITATHWGTNILYVQAEDNAGNLSPVNSYSFYAPWNPNGPAPVFGDVTGDGAPDIVTPDTAGNLRAYTVPGNPLAKAPATQIAAKRANSPGGDSWANYRTTHRGSLTGGKNVDDLIVHKDGDPVLNYYKNPGNTGVPGVFDTRSTLGKPACDQTLTDCTGYHTGDWTTTLQIAASGDPSTTNLDPAKKFLNRTGLFTVETNPEGDGALWFYPTVGDAVLGAPTKLSATGWKGWDLIAPGDWWNQGRPGLWARNHGNGDLRGYTFTTGTVAIDDGFGGSVTFPTLKTLATNTLIGKVDPSTAGWPLMGSDGDLTGSGHSTLWGITADNSIQIWTGVPAGTASAPGYTWQTGPTPVLSTSTGPDRWALDGASTNNGTALDDTGLNPAGLCKYANGVNTCPSTAVLTTDHKGRASAAVDVSNGSYLKAAPAVDTSRSYSVSAWVKANDLTDYQTFVTQNGSERGAFYLQYSKAYGHWSFVAPAADSYTTGAYYNATDTATTQTGQWTHLVGTYDVATHVMTLYVNGKYAGSGTNPTPWNATTSLTIGATGTAKYPIDNQAHGAVSDVRTYPYALTAEQVGALFTA
ncbi:LamG-like jellyroll fold domain-containing protein [Kitasatospora sp. NPDC088134]|uniref:LamG-like jellyroll fold domain-containing protein n=1 Tax=Kitasatospora sp. NPDC088134 TaxID=3364071 RepID=UPI003829DFC7